MLLAKLVLTGTKPTIFLLFAKRGNELLFDWLPSKPSSHNAYQRQAGKVFLLLFVHKKKILPFLLINGFY